MITYERDNNFKEKILPPEKLGYVQKEKQKELYPQRYSTLIRDFTIEQEIIDQLPAST